MPAKERRRMRKTWSSWCGEFSGNDQRAQQTDRFSRGDAGCGEKSRKMKGSVPRRRLKKAGRYGKAASSRRTPELRDEVEGALGLEKLEVAEDVGFDFVRLGFAVELLQVGDELGDGVFAVAAGNDFEARAVEAESAFGHQQNFLTLVFAEADAGGELRFGVGINRHRFVFSG